MKLIFSLLILISYQATAQQENNQPLFLTLEEVDNSPAFPGCENEEFASCSRPRIADFLMQKIDPALLFSLEEAENFVNIRFIIDSKGKVRRPMAMTKDEKLRDAANEVLSNLPDFKPGTHENQPVNVIIEVPVKLTRGYPSETEEDMALAGDTLPGNLNPAPIKTLPIAIACEGTAEPEKCSANWVQVFVMKNFNSYKVKGKNEFLKVVVHFIVDEEGKVTDVTAEGEHDKMKKEAIKAVKKLPDFIPATEEGKIVPYNYTMPITVQGSSYRG